LIRKKDVLLEYAQVTLYLPLSLVLDLDKPGRDAIDFIKSCLIIISLCSI
jgi:hypothetical protein